MATLLRPPLVFRPQYRPWVAAVDPIVRPLTLGITTSTPKALQALGSAPIGPARLSVDAYSNLLQSTLAGDSINVPVAQLYGSAPIGRHRLTVDVYPNLLQTTLQPLPALTLPLLAQDVIASAPPARYRVQLDTYPNLIQTTLSGLTTFRPPLSSGKWSDSAPPARYRIQLDTYPNLFATTLAPVTIPLPLIAQRLDWSAPIPPKRVQVDQPMQRPICLNPVPQFQQWDDSAPIPRYRPQIDVYPNMTVLGIAQNAKALQASDSAPIPDYRPQVDTYPNLLSTTLKPADVLGLPLAAIRMDWSAPPAKPMAQPNTYPNMALLGIPTILTPTSGQTITISGPDGVVLYVNGDTSVNG